MANDDASAMVSISFEKVTLSNGLEVILHQDHTIPLVAVNVWYHVGSKDEAPGRTGFAHLFEHVMFEGSKHHNRSTQQPEMSLVAAESALLSKVSYMARTTVF